ncbi:MAG: metal ABC transporter ATP-binding protein [Verrucomicrobiae bacterium]|nr:metal ABC transporter ATP-binding protein [Verrucomicrobiae bacterium]
MTTEMSAPRIQVEGVTVAYQNRHRAIEDISLTLEAGTICALVGVNGSGKSTLFKAIMGFLKPDQGRVLIGGRPVREVRKLNWVAYVPQTEEVDWTFPVSVWDVVMMGRYGRMNFLRIPTAEDRRIVRESLERVDLFGYRDRQIGELSGGQKKRVFLARALAQQGRIMLLDEPFTGVDVGTESAIIELLARLRLEGHIVLVSTHNLGMVPDFCDQVALINRTLLAFGRTSRVFTEENLSRAFGGVLRHFRFAESTVDDTDGRAVTLLTDDERPVVLGRGGHLEYKKGGQAGGEGDV